MKISRTTTTNNKGFTLVEVLVAVVILSIGLLAVAGMQTTSLKGGNNALYRSQAVLGAEDIMDRMRANRAVALTNDYRITFAQAPGDVGTHLGIVLTDLTEWRDSLTTNLPSGQGSVAVAGGIATVIVRWTDSYGGAAEGNQVEMVTRL